MGGGCCLGSDCGILVTILAILLVVFAIIFPPLWFATRSYEPNFSVVNATLNEFNYTNNTTLHYDLVLNVTVRNSNKKKDFYFNYVEALALFQDVKFSSQNLGTFNQPHKNTTMLTLVFKGQQVMPLSADQISEMYKETRSGVYNINVKFYIKVWFMRSGDAHRVSSEVHCNLQVPLQSSNGTSPTRGFQATHCK